MGGFIAQTLALQHPGRINKLILLSTDPGGADAELASADVWSQLIDMSGTPHEQARRLLSLVFPSDIAESIYREFGDIVAAARAQLSPDLVNRQVAAMDAWHRTGIGNRLREINVPVFVATGTADIVIPPSNALRLVNAIPGAWLAQFNGGGHAFMAQYPRPLADLINSFLELEMKHSTGAICHRRSTRPRFPAFADRLRVAVNVDLFQLFYAIFYCFGRAFIFFPG